MRGKTVCAYITRAEAFALMVGKRHAHGLKAGTIASQLLKAAARIDQKKMPLFLRGIDRLVAELL